MRQNLSRKLGVKARIFIMLSRVNSAKGVVCETGSLHMSVGSTLIMKHKQYHTKHKIHTVEQDHHILGSFGAVTTGLFLAIICRPSAL